jgi:chromosome segregation ATPase
MKEQIEKEIKKQEYALKRMTAQMQDHTRKIGELKVQSEKIRERIQELKNQYEVQV